MLTKGQATSILAPSLSRCLSLRYQVSEMSSYSRQPTFSLARPACLSTILEMFAPLVSAMVPCARPGSPSTTGQHSALWPPQPCSAAQPRSSASLEQAATESGDTRDLAVIGAVAHHCDDNMVSIVQFTLNTRRTVLFQSPWLCEPKVQGLLTPGSINP